MKFTLFQITIYLYDKIEITTKNKDGKVRTSASPLPCQKSRSSSKKMISKRSPCRSSFRIDCMAASVCWIFRPDMDPLRSKFKIISPKHYFYQNVMANISILNVEPSFDLQNDHNNLENIFQVLILLM